MAVAEQARWATLPLTMSDAPRDTDELTQQRAQLDQDILALLLRRARLSREVGRAGQGVAKLPSTERDTTSRVP